MVTAREPCEALCRACPSAINPPASCRRDPQLPGRTQAGDGVGVFFSYLLLHAAANTSLILWLPDETGDRLGAQITNAVPARAGFNVWAAE